MKSRLVLPSVLASLLLLLAVPNVGCRPSAGGQGSQQGDQTVYDRVVRNGKIRAAFVNYPPGCIVDKSTGKVSGIAIEALQKICDNAGLKIEFTEEVGWGTMIQGLENGRYDMVGSPMWANPMRGKLTTLSKPIYYTGIGIWVRAGENRFSPVGNWASINSPEVRIAAMDGSTPEIIARTQFPRAKLVTYPDTTGEPQLFMDVTTNKVDVFFAEPSQGINFLKNNPGKVRNIAAGAPIRIFGNVYMMPKGEPQFKMMIDTGIEELENSGFIDNLLKKYEPGPGAFYRPERPYRVSMR